MSFPVPLTLGVEEEYQIIDPHTRELTAYIQHLLDRDSILGGQIKPEFLQSQIEMGTQICSTVKELRQEMRRLRGQVSELADRAGVRIAAAGTHPFSHWADQVITDRQRYIEFAADMGHVVRSLLIFGMHVHVGFGSSFAQRELMITVMNQARYFLPHLLALSTSSPFWMGELTGLKSYRSIVFRQMPRTGIPMSFGSWSEYEHHIRVLSRIGSLGEEARDTDQLGDTTRIWWDLRPHPRYHTLEFRVCDVVTTIDEAVCIAALFQAIVAMLIRLRERNLSWRPYPRDFINENKWRAVRYGVEGSLVDFGKEREVPLPDLIDELVELLDEVVDELDCREEVAYARHIARSGSSADRQIGVYHQHILAGAAPQEALRAVVDHLIEETARGV
ncbi:MAG: carboxylate-amine ligase [Anaerolineae bacterium]